MRRTGIRVGRWVCATTIAIAAASGCAHRKAVDTQLEHVAKDWCMTIRASQIIPVYPLSEDVEVGDVYLVQSSIEDQVEAYKANGFLPFDLLVTRLAVLGYKDFYRAGYKLTDASDVPRAWQFPRANDATTDWSWAPISAFPTYKFEVRQSQGLGLAVPVQAIPVGLNLLNASNASGSIAITNASTYGLPQELLEAAFDDWSARNQKLLTRYAPYTDREGRQRRNYLRVVSRVYVTGGVQVSLYDATSKGADVQAAALKSMSLLTAANGSEANAVATNYSDVLAKLNQSLVAAENTKEAREAAEKTFGGRLQIAAATGRSVTMTETFRRPLVVGYLAFDREIEESGALGPVIATRQLIDGTSYGADEPSSQIDCWLSRADANRQRLRSWLQRNGIDPELLPNFIVGAEYASRRAQAVKELRIGGNCGT